MRIVEPFGDWVAAEYIPMPEQMTASGIVLARRSAAVEVDAPPGACTLQIGRVTQVGKGRLNDAKDGTVPVRVKTGDVVLFNKEMAEPMLINGVETVLFREGAIAATIELDENETP